MFQCDGLDDWLKCTYCKHICTPACPIEGQNVIANLSRRLNIMDSKGEVSPVSKGKTQDDLYDKI